jgi:hypothetical protein
MMLAIYTGNSLYIEQASPEQYKNYIWVVLYYDIKAGRISLIIFMWNICPKQEPKNQAETNVAKERLFEHSIA